MSFQTTLSEEEESVLQAPHPARFDEEELLPGCHLAYDNSQASDNILFLFPE